MLTVTNLNAGYGKLVVLHNLSLTIAAKQFTAILGPNGSGKSTLLKTIFGLTHVFDGAIQFNGQNIVGLLTEDIGRRGIAYVPQRANIFTSMTVHENLLLAARLLPKAEAPRALKDAYELFPILPKREHQHAGQLSGGERQMVAIAMGWLAHPRLMLLDEPTAGLSPLFAAEVLQTLKELTGQDITIAVVEQNARAALQWCDYVYILREGQVAFNGTAAECRADEETIKNYLGVGIGKKLSTIELQRLAVKDGEK